MKNLTTWNLALQAEDSVDDDVLNSFCWMYTSFDTPPSFTSPCTRKKYDGTFLYNTYYQWVSIFLGFLAVVYYIPRCVWIMLEGNLMEILVKGTGKDKKKSLAILYPKQDKKVLFWSYQELAV